MNNMFNENQANNFSKAWDNARESLVNEESTKFEYEGSETDDKDINEIIFDNQMDHPLETLDNIFDIFNK